MPAQSGSGRRQVLFVDEVLQLPQKTMVARSMSLQSSEVEGSQHQRVLDIGSVEQGVCLIKHCHKLDRKEFSKVVVRMTIGFMVMGFVGGRI
ncbi:hypothetical protein C4D60_Mb10t27670 [Musa balbisiana]|uniref:Uncharacterized protein n=1 Tax=Musa balbisiana TaxID=52838 RepID=A0A4S8J063_MUSBA|nr:hypothetical protein C4D60_Mb10t27670 [Musa balbisiana]